MIRLDKLVSERFGLSRRTAQEAVRRGQVDLGGQPCLEPGREVQPDSPVVYAPNRPRPEVAARRLRVLYEDAQILVIDKPSGLLTQPTAARERDTLLERAGRYLARTRGTVKPYVGMVHRLDRDTSGVILLVTTPTALRPFQALFRTHSIERRYLAAVEGILQPTKRTIDLPIVADRGDGRRGTPRNGEKGTPAVTHYEVLEYFGSAASLVACHLETGRTHQIRIHLAEIGHPVIADAVYKAHARRPFRFPFVRHALHAQALGFVHPISGLTLRIEAPLPLDLAEWLDSLRHEYGRRTPEPA